MITKQFVLAGKAVFTIRDKESSRHRTFQVTKKEWGPGRCNFFVSMLTGPNNEDDYVYIGALNVRTGNVYPTRASKMREGSPIMVVLCEVLTLVWNEEEHKQYIISTAGRCGRCGRPLTRPEGIEPEGYRFGFGPDCWATMQQGATV